MGLEEFIEYCWSNKTLKKVVSKIERTQIEWADALYWAPVMAGVPGEVRDSFLDVDLVGYKMVERLHLVHVCKSDEVRIYDIYIGEGHALGSEILKGYHFFGEKFGIFPTLVKVEISILKPKIVIINPHVYYDKRLHEDAQREAIKIIGRNN